METSSERAHSDDYRIRHAETKVCRHSCWQCDETYDTREVKFCGITRYACRDCRPFDHPCDCGKGECLPGTQECLSCAIAEDLRPLIRARFARALFHVAGGLMLDKIAGGVQ